MPETRPRRLAPTFMLLSLLGLGMGCGWKTTPLYSFGQYDMPQEEMFNRLSQTLTSRGYQLQAADASRGMLVVQASYVHRGSASTFTVQCYRDGWVGVRMSGGFVRMSGDSAKVPGALHDEYRTIVLALSESLGGSPCQVGIGCHVLIGLRRIHEVNEDDVSVSLAVTVAGDDRRDAVP